MKMKLALVTIMFALLATLILGFVSLPAASAQAVIWTDKPDYAPSETVTIFGGGFNASADVAVTIERPDGTIDTVYAVANDVGGFTCTYQLDGITGTYTVTATDETNTATTTFDDPPPPPTTSTISFSPSSPVTAGTVDTITGTVVVTSSGNPVTSGTIQIREYELSGVGVPYPTSGANWVVIASGTPNGYGKFSYDFDTTGLGGTTIGFQSHYVPAGSGYGESLSAPSNLVINAPVTTATITFYQTGVGTDFTGTVLTIDGSTANEVDLTVNDFDGTHNVFTWNIGSSHTFAYASPLVVTINSKQYVWTSTTGLSTAQSGTIIVPSLGGSVTGNYKTQYYLTMSTNFGTVSPGSGWHDAGGSPFDISATAPALVYSPAEERYVWNGWTGTGTGSYSGTNNPASITMNGPITETASWTHQYYLTVTSAHDTPGGMGWYGENTNAYATLATGTVNDGPGIRYVFTGWSGDASGTGLTSNAIYMNGPKTATANWETQYHVVVDWSGLGGDASGKIVTVTVDSTPYVKNVGDSFFDEWIDSTKSVSYSFESYVASTVLGKRFALDYVSGTSTDASHDFGVISGPIAETGVYKIQYEVKVDWSGLGGDAKTGEKIVTITVDGTPYVKNVGDSSFDEWIDSTKSVSYTYEDVVSSTTTGKRYKLDTVTGTSTDVSYTFSPITGPITETGNYKIQFYLTLATNPAAVGVSHITASPSSTDGYYDINTEVKLTADQYVDIVAGSSRYRFDQWTVDSTTENTNPMIVKMDSAKSVTAFYIIQYYLTVDTSPVAGIDSPTGEGWYDTGVTAHVSTAQYVDIVPGSSRYRFDHWTGASGGYSDATVLMDSAKTATANYIVQYKLTVASDRDNPTPSVGDHWYDTGTEITASVTSPADESDGTRYRCTGWSGTGSVPASGTSTSVTFNLAAPSSITWNWITQYLLTVSTSPALSPQPTVTFVSGYDSGGGWYDTGSLVSIDPNSPAGYTFDHWSGDASGSDVPLSVTMDSAKNIVAVFKFNLAVQSGFKPGDSPSFASDPYLSDIMCVLKVVTGTTYTLVGTSPGTFDYAISIKNTGTDTFTSITIAVTGSSDFRLQSSNPIRVLDVNGVDITAQFTITGTWPTITISSKPSFQGLPGSASLYVTIHLDYALKGTSVNVPTLVYNRHYTFTTHVTGTSGSNSGFSDAWGSVVFLSKKTTIIYGFVKTFSGMPKEDVTVELRRNGALVGSVETDADGFFCFIDGADSVSLSGGTTYTVICGGTSKSVTAKAGSAVSVNFQV